MSYHSGPISTLGFPAAADYRTTGLYRFMVITTDKTVRLPSAGERVFGVLQNEPREADIASVMSMGLSKVVSGSALDVGTFVKTDDAGRAVPADTDKDNIAGLVVHGVSGEDRVATILLRQASLSA